ncbi:MAG: NADH-quinone oxidoreductase subunit F [Gammaproteobacteria bacterium]|nr:NADH-quinone oxidoreductase subunit F [Gammaproteobacteria bacterium]
MVDPLFFITSALGTAFFLGFLRDEWRTGAYFLTLLALAFTSWLSADWLWFFAVEGGEAVMIQTAGTMPPFAINLRLGLTEAVGLLMVNLTTLLSAIYLKNTLLKKGRRAMAVFLVFSMALGGIILTRDLFNLFVFIELTVVSTGGLVLLSSNRMSLGAGLKYLIASQLISILLLIGIIFTYHNSGSLNIDFMAAVPANLKLGSSLALFLVLIAVIIELKPFPANGWALDIYESAHPAFSALLSAAAGTATLFAIDKLLLIGGSGWLPIITAIGILSFIGANLFALAQTNDRRLLGYSSVGQIGLILVIVGQRELLGDNYWFIAGGVLLAHAIAKAGLFWLSGLVKSRELSAWSSIRSRPLLLFAFISFVALLIGLPPFPGFYAKWDLIHVLAAEGKIALLGFILFGALLEAGYLFRWFGYIIKHKQTDKAKCSLQKVSVIYFAVALGWGLAYVWGQMSEHSNLMLAIPLLFALAFIFIEWLPVWIKNSIAIAGMLYWFVISLPSYDPLQLVFAVIILIGGALIFLSSYHTSGKRLGFYPAAMLMYAGLSLLIVAEDSFSFFAAWESLTVGSYLLILRGQNSQPHALSYILFSLAGAFVIMAGFALAAQGDAQFLIASLSQVDANIAPWVFILLAIGFMTKTASIGFHIWLPGAHAEAETDVSPMLSGILLKAGLFGLFILLMNMGKQQLYGIELTHVLMWIGALSALLGNLLAIFQEDAKRLLAYSSIGQMGYALFGLAMMNHLGWLMALMFVINHYIYKSMLFLSIGGVAKRTGTKEMYRMGGLITLMPLSFIATLIGIIAVSGVPPLSGFGGRWIFYNAIMTAEYRLPMVIIFLAGPIAFLYLFRLIHTIFLGQLKDEHRRLKEAPFWLIVPQMIYVVCLLVFAMVPGLALRHVDQYINQFFPQGGLNWDGLTITSNFGYWSPISVMIVVAVIFVSLFAWLLFINRKAQKVKQFNIVYSAERPYRPETTHYAWNFFAPYRKALGFLTQPLVTIFWNSVMDLLHTSAELLRRFYTGDGQTYAVQLLAFVVAVYLFKVGL